MNKFIVYATSTPFPGYLLGHGKVNPDMPPDGSTVMERLESLPAGQSYVLLPLAMEIPDRETHKWDAESGFIPLDPGDVTPALAATNATATKKQAFIDNLPSWAQVEAAVQGISNLEEAKAFLGKLARVVYWLAKDSAE